MLRKLGNARDFRRGVEFVFQSLGRFVGEFRLLGQRSKRFRFVGAIHIRAYGAFGKHGVAKRFRVFIDGGQNLFHRHIHHRSAFDMDKLAIAFH